MTTIAYDVTVRRIGFDGGDIKVHLFAISDQVAIERAMEQAKSACDLPPRRKRYAVLALVSCEVSADQTRTRHAAPFAKTDRGFARRAERLSKQRSRALCFAVGA
ncbi:hypothetical protein ACRQ5Q_14785 [Bradyrhizobium sp. PMVTL-01]|uniref:hypothetical protein n=1 Tax=Bradyrhizobium sp. PMVTL-01 TaxID=3434999 RepID=UPI003F70B092